MLQLLNIWTFVMLSIIVNIGNMPELIDWVLTAFDWVQNSMNLRLKIFLNDCQNLCFIAKIFDWLPKFSNEPDNQPQKCSRFGVKWFKSITKFWEYFISSFICICFLISQYLSISLNIFQYLSLSTIGSWRSYNIGKYKLWWKNLDKFLLGQFFVDASCHKIPKKHWKEYIHIFNNVGFCIRLVCC